jgi:hypothetical protein
MVEIVLLSIILILLLHLVVLPRLQHRAVMFEGFEASLLFFTTIALIASLTHPFVFFFALGFSLTFFYTNNSLILGVSAEKVQAALNQAIAATRSQSNINGQTITIDNALEITITRLGGATCRLRSKTKTASKKAALTSIVFRKFLLNYSI